MKRSIIGIVILLAMGQAATAGEPRVAPTVRLPWYKRWFGIGPEPPKPAPPPKPKDPAIEAANARAQAEADLIRRQSVCLELRQYAEEKDDPVLRAKVDALERQAWEIYKLQTAHLPCSRLVPTTEEKLLEERLRIASSADEAEDRLLPPINISNRQSQASATRGVKP